MNNTENITPLQELHRWVDTELKLLGYEHNEILEKIESLFEYEGLSLELSFQKGKADCIKKLSKITPY